MIFFATTNPPPVRYCTALIVVSLCKEVIENEIKTIKYSNQNR